MRLLSPSHKFGICKDLRNPTRRAIFFAASNLIQFTEMSLVKNQKIGHNRVRTRPLFLASNAEETAMAFNLRLPALLAKMRWKVKIRDKERVEDPHITIIRGTSVWRVSLRDGRFMDGGSWKDMPNSLQQVIQEPWQQLCNAWDEMYPSNPIRGEEEDNDDDNA